MTSSAHPNLFPAVEVIGVPGSGKSVLLSRALAIHREVHPGAVADLPSALFDGLRSTGHDAVSAWLTRVTPRRVGARRGLRLFARSIAARDSLAAFLVEHPELFAVFLRITVEHARSETPVEAVVNANLEVFSAYEFALAPREATVPLVLDEGFVQHLVINLAGSDLSSDRTALEEYLTLTPLPRAVVHVRADPSLCYERVVERAVRQGRPQGWPTLIPRPRETVGREWIERAAGVLDVVVAELARRGVVVAEVENTGSLEDMHASADGALRSLLDG